MVSLTDATVVVPQRRVSRGGGNLGYWFLLPALVVIACTLLVPLLYNLWTSFHDFNLLRPKKNAFVGLANYIKVMRDPAQLASLWTTIRFTAMAVVGEVVLGTALALLLNINFIGNRIVRTLVLLPMLVSEVVAGLSWQLVFNTEFGLLNYIVSLVGLPKQVWLGPTFALPSVLTVELWQHTPFVALIVLAGLQTVPRELLEAAEMDGATRWQKFWSVTFPLLLPIILLALVFRTMFSLRVFTPVWVLTAGGPADQTLVVGVDIYRTAFRYYDVGISATLSIVLLAITLVITLIYMRLLRTEATA
ncbi:MAG TPA: sugar ABC transporter permease [Devosiaceae bacterium]|jgi:multiple sugar transport system permease protein